MKGKVVTDVIVCRSARVEKMCICACTSVFISEMIIKKKKKLVLFSLILRSALIVIFLGFWTKRNGASAVLGSISLFHIQAFSQTHTHLVLFAICCSDDLCKVHNCILVILKFFYISHITIWVHDFTYILQRMKELQASEANRKLLRLSIESGGCSGFQYNFLLDDKANDDDRLYSLFT